MDASRTGHLGAAFVMHDADLDALNRLLKDFGDDIEYNPPRTSFGDTLCPRPES
jgi:hypothetical protein